MKNMPVRVRTGIMQEFIPELKNTWTGLRTSLEFIISTQMPSAACHNKIKTMMTRDFLSFKILQKTLINF